MIPRLESPWLICGDFNAPPQTCFTGGHDIRLPPLPQPTYPARQPAEAIDYCVTSPGITAHTTVLQAGGSDHLPLLVTASPEYPRP
jgi:endonuclease/exonuclease/phosphatase family metal-dependent hydrolase